MTDVVKSETNEAEDESSLSSSSSASSPPRQSFRGVHLGRNYKAIVRAIRDQVCPFPVENESRSGADGADSAAPKAPKEEQPRRAKRTVLQLMGGLDAPKLTSSVRLFEEAATGEGGDDELRVMCRQVRLVCEAQEAERKRNKAGNGPRRDGGGSRW